MSVRLPLAVLLWSVGATAVAGGVALVAGWVAPGTELLAGSPFSSYLLPGALLLAVGLVHLAAAWLLHRRHRLDWFWAGLAGGAMVVYEVVEFLVIGYHWLQAVYLLAGAATGLLALALRRGRQADAAG